MSPNLIDVGANIVRLTVYYLFLVATGDVSPAPLRKGDLVLFTGEIAYLIYNWCLISGFLLKLKNPGKDVLRLAHKPARCQLRNAVLDDLDIDQPLDEREMPQKV